MELKRRSIFFSFFIESLLAKASITNCRFKGLSGVCFRRLKEKPNKRTVVKTNFPSSNGMISNPAAGVLDEPLSMDDVNIAAREAAHKVERLLLAYAG